MANLTIAINDDLLQKARLRAMEQGTSVNALLRDYLEHYAGGAEAYQRATDTILTIAQEAGRGSEGRRWTREELHNRDGLR